MKGHCVLAVHPPFDLGKGVVIDVLRDVYLGVVKRLMGYWFKADHKREDYSIHAQVHRQTLSHTFFISSPK